MDETQLSFELIVSFIHLLLPENSTSLRTQSVTHTSFTPRKLKMGWMKLNFPSNSECHSYIFYSPKTQLPFEIKVSLIHLLPPKNSKWDG